MIEKIAVVTGASSGFGKEISLALAKKGFYVFAAARRLQLLENIASDKIEPMVLDVTKEESVYACQQHILNTKGRVDLLVNNAGHGFYSPIEDADISAVQYQFDVNVFGPVRMIQAMLPAMRKNRSGMIINISSVVGQISMPLFGFYAGSKHALEALSDALRMEVKQFGIKTVIVEPGAFKTNFRETALKLTDVNNENTAYQKLIHRALKVLSTSYEQAPEPEQVAHLVASIAQSKNPHRRYVIGQGSKLFMFTRKYLGYVVLDKVLSRIFGT